MKLSDRMKDLESLEAGRCPASRGFPIIVRLDGRGFSKWSRPLKGKGKPYDNRLCEIMADVAMMLVHESKARIGYTQSDEITLVIHEPDEEKTLYFSGRFQKICSVLASLASVLLNDEVRARIPELAGHVACFDARAWAVPSESCATEVLLWREMDAVRNSVSMAAQAHFHHSQLAGVKTQQMKDMLLEQGVSWDSYPASFKRGCYVQKRSFEEAISPDVLAKIPEGIRPPPGATFERSRVVRVSMPPFISVGNKTDVVFRGHEPMEGLVHEVRAVAFDPEEE